MLVSRLIDHKNEIIEKYIPLVKYIASRVIIGKTKYIEYEDLVSYGMIGLMDALNKFDSEKGMKFSTYASIRIKGSMIDEIRKNSPISKGAMDKLNKYNATIEKLQKSLMREPSNIEIAKELNMTLNGVAEIERYINYISIVSLENVIFSDDDDISIMSVIADKNSPSPEKIIEKKEGIRLLKMGLDMLNDKDKTVLSLYYYEGLTLKQIGKVLEVSESRVCQLHGRAIRNLRDIMKKNDFL